MPDRYDYKMKRLYVSAGLSNDTVVEFNSSQSNYVANVLRFQSGAQLLLFNGQDGEWLAEISRVKKWAVTAKTIAPRRPQPAPSSFCFAFAPLKVGRMDYLVQKAVEMGVGRLQPVVTEFTQHRHPKLDKLHAYAVEAAAQCGILSLAKIDPPIPLTQFISDWVAQEHDRILIFADESDEGTRTIDQISLLQPGEIPGLLTGPEGGFSPAERAALYTVPSIKPVGLGPRILRADTAAVAAMAMIQLHWGDW